jgi:hypothetical protein
MVAPVILLRPRMSGKRLAYDHQRAALLALGYEVKEYTSKDGKAAFFIATPPKVADDV